MGKIKMDIRFDREKFKDLVHYVCAACSDTELLGAIKLNKILWLSELLSYLNDGQSLTGENYLKRQFGPVPGHILSVLEELESEQKILVRNVTQYGRPKREFISLEEISIDWLSVGQLKMIDDVIEDICQNHTASTVSKFSHTQVYDAAKTGENIPHFAMLMADMGEINDNDIKRAEEFLQAQAA